jgi:hypothetical protein
VAALDEALPDLTHVLRDAGGDALVGQVAPHLAHLVKSTYRFMEFMVAFDPGPPANRPSFEWARVPWHELRRRLGLIYGYRSACLHEGVPFPGPLCVPPVGIGEELLELPPGLWSAAGSTQWSARDLPMYLWVFEHVVRGALLRWCKEHLGVGPR